VCGNGTSTYDGAEIADLPGVVRAEMARGGVPGMTVGVQRDGDVSIHGFGVANVSTGAPVAPGTLFQIGSISKVFFATLVMRLVEAGTVMLDAPLNTYLPDLALVDSSLPGRLTLRHVLTHTSGLLGDHFPDEGMGDDALATVVAKMRDLPQITPPDAGWSYCNSGFYLGGRVIEVVTGKTFEAAMQDEVFDPLGLPRATFFAHEAILHSAAAGHQHTDNGPEVAKPYPLARCANPPGGIISRVAELLTFAAFHMGDGTLGAAGGERVLSPESLAQMQTPQVRVNAEGEWGLGWSLGRVGGVRTIGHNGATNGFQAYLVAVPERNYALAMLTNSSRGTSASRGIAKWALARDLGLETPEPTRIELAPDALNRLTGVYRQALSVSTISVADGADAATSLEMRVVSVNPFTGEETERPSVGLAPIAPDACVITSGENAGIRVDFIFPEDPAAPPTMARIGSRLSTRE
jgi:CubicO group peptidase (beta-lactamase class C family)